MKRSLVGKLVQFMALATLAAFGVPVAQAGPGGGTYYANSPAGGA